MGKYDGFLLITDFDGTLAIKGEVSPENQAAIREFQKEGGLYTIASGRQPEWLSKFESFFKCNTYAVLMNGTIFYDTEKKESAVLSPLGKEVFEFTKEIWKNFPETEYLRFFSYDKLYDFKKDDIIPDEVINTPIYKIILRPTEALSDEYLKGMEELCRGKYFISRSWIKGIELQALGTSKGDAVRYFKKKFKGKIHTVIAAGDYENDIEMLKAADIGYAVGDAQDSVKAVADRITVPCSEHAIAKIIEEIKV